MATQVGIGMGAGIESPPGIRVRVRSGLQRYARESVPSLLVVALLVAGFSACGSVADVPVAGTDGVEIASRGGSVQAGAGETYELELHGVAPGARVEGAEDDAGDDKEDDATGEEIFPVDDLVDGWVDAGRELEVHLRGASPVGEVALLARAPRYSPVWGTLTLSVRGRADADHESLERLAGLTPSASSDNEGRTFGPTELEISTPGPPPESDPGCEFCNSEPPFAVSWGVPRRDPSGAVVEIAHLQGLGTWPAGAAETYREALKSEFPQGRPSEWGLVIDLGGLTTIDFLFASELARSLDEYGGPDTYGSSRWSMGFCGYDHVLRRASLMIGAREILDLRRSSNYISDCERVISGKMEYVVRIRQAATLDRLCHDGVRNGDEADVDCGGSCVAQWCWLGSSCGRGQDCATTYCSGGRCRCRPWSFSFAIRSTKYEGFAAGETWPGNLASQAEGNGCGVTVQLPNDRVDKICTLADGFRVMKWEGYSRCRPSGGQDGCHALTCPPLGLASCCAGRPGCSQGTTWFEREGAGHSTARFDVICEE